MLTPIRKPIATLTRGRYAYHLRQHDRQRASVNVFLWGPYSNSCLLSVFPRAHRVLRGSKLFWLRLVYINILPRRSWLFWLRVVFCLVGVGCFGYV